MSDPVRIGLIGAGAVVQVAHLPVLKKLKNVESTGAACVVACDAGCLMQLGGGLRRRGSSVRAVHLAELIDGERR